MKKESQFKISIIIPVYNRKEITIKGIKKICEVLEYAISDQIQYEIIVIDDASTDGTYEYIRENFQKIILLKGTGNLWWSGGVNMGVKYAMSRSSTHILLWNDDIVPRYDYFKVLNQIVLNDDGNTVYGSTIYDMMTNTLWFHGAHYYSIRGEIKHIRELGSQIQTNCLTGMGTLVNTEIIKNIGFWNNTLFPQYYGDVDFTLRAYENGFKIVVVDDLVIFNDTSKSSYNQEESLKKYIKSLFSLQSRYNISKDIAFNKIHARFALWPYGVAKKHIKYLYRNII